MPVFVRIFNTVFHSGIVPDSWSEGYICPIYKNKGNPNDVDNYRGITILSCYGKLFTCILNNRLHTYLENSGLMCEEQAGFRKGYSTTDHIFILKCLIDLYLLEVENCIVYLLIIAKLLILLEEYTYGILNC